MNLLIKLNYNLGYIRNRIIALALIERVKQYLCHNETQISL